MIKVHLIKYNNDYYEAKGYYQDYYFEIKIDAKNKNKILDFKIMSKIYKDYYQDQIYYYVMELIENNLCVVYLIKK